MPDDAGRVRWAVLRYGFGLGTFALALGVLRLPTVAEGPGTAILVAFYAILLASWGGGLGPGLMVTGLFVAMAWPESMPAWRLVRLLLFVAGGAGISVLVGSLDASRRRAEGEAREREEARDRIASLNQDLRRRVAELEAVFEVVPVGIGIAEDAVCRTIRVNGEFARSLGLAPGANASLSTPEGERPGHFRVLREGREVAASELPLQLAASRGVAVRDVELDVVHDDGRVVTLLESAVPLYDERGAVRGCVGSFRDVTELKRAREELRRAKEEAEAANRAKDLFLAMLSHELRTPLTPALLSVTGLLADATLPAELRGPLEVVRRGIALEARLVDDLLDVMRAGTGKLRLERAPIDAHEAIRRAVEASAADVESAGLRLEVDLAAVESRVDGDAGRLQQVAWNLLKNSAKFTPRGGVVTLRTRNEPGGCACRTTRLVVEVADTGAGLSPADLERIFAPFAQVSEGCPRGVGGMGLGLAIARGLAEAHGGRLSAASDGPGRGSTFRLELPTIATAAEAPPRPPEAEAAEAGWPSRILLVEDDRSTARVLARLLGWHGAEVTIAHTLAEGRAAAEAGGFDVIVSDLGLPDGSGLDLLAGLPLGGPPAIALTGYGTEDDARRSRESGFAAHLTKPLDLAAVEAAIRRVVGRGA